MIRRFTAGAVLALGLAATPAHVRAAPTVDQALAALRFLTGTWHCAHQVGDFSGTYTQTFASALDGRWLRQTYEFPATSSEPAVHAEYFVGYDERVGRYVRFGAHSNGQYYGQYSTSPGDAGWLWTYVLPGANATSMWTKQSDTRYTIDGPSYPQNGRTVTEHHDCRKAG